MISKIFKASLCKTPTSLDKLNSANTGPEDLRLNQMHGGPIFRSSLFLQLLDVQRGSLQKSAALPTKSKGSSECKSPGSPGNATGIIQGAGYSWSLEKCHKRKAGEGVTAPMQSTSHESSWEQLTQEVYTSGEHQRLPDMGRLEQARVREGIGTSACWATWVGFSAAEPQNKGQGWCPRKRISCNPKRQFSSTTYLR